MAKGIVTSFSVNAATNGYTLSYCVKTKTLPAAGQTYGNTDYKDVSEVYEADNVLGLLASIKKLCGVIEDDAKKDAGDDNDDDYPTLSKG